MIEADPLGLAVDYLLATRSADERTASRLEQQMAALDGEQLAASLSDDASRMAFWIDVYNAAVVRQVHYDFGTALARQRFFRRPVVSVAGQPLSLDAIEHGILRRSRWKLGLGYVANPLPSRFERGHRVDSLDARIHFALNCAAASCPPIAAYRVERIDEQLELAVRSYLATAADRSDGSTAIPRILLWYIGDFGGPSGVRALLRKHDVQVAAGRLRFADYDWTPASGRWVDDPEEE